MKILLTVPPGCDRTETRDHLDRAGVEVCTAADGHEAIRVLEASAPDVAVVDRRLDDLNGDAVVGWLKDHRHLFTVPVVLIVKREDLAAAEHLSRLGVSDLILEPVCSHELVARVFLNARPRALPPGLFAPGASNRFELQEAVVAYLGRQREREEEALGLFLTDPETGLNNRPYFKIKLGEELKRAERYRAPMSALLIKLCHGRESARPPAPMTLKEIAGILLLESRDLDVIGRYGPSDFALVLPSTGQDGAVLLAQRISERIITHRFVENEGGRDFQVRIGVATYPLGGSDGPHHLMRRANEALMKAQSFGDKEICIWESGSEAAQ